MGKDTKKNDEKPNDYIIFAQNDAKDVIDSYYPNPRMAHLDSISTTYQQSID